MKIIHLCPSNIATGGTDGIHHLVSELNKCGADACILYVGKSENPQPKEYEHYNCPFITEFPKDFDGVVIFPEIWGDKVVEPQYKNCKVVINWQGVDVYLWNTPVAKRYSFLKRKDCVHITNLEYGMVTLRNLGLRPIKISDCVNDLFFDENTQEFNRKDVVLYNPMPVKLTKFQERVMGRCTTELGIKFLALEGYTQEELRDIFRHHKLYIDFGVFSGRERLPREAVLSGCCIITSRLGAAGYPEDNPILDMYKTNDIETAIKAIKYVLQNYELCKPNFNTYRDFLKKDRENFSIEVKKFYEILNNNSSI